MTTSNGCSPHEAAVAVSLREKLLSMTTCMCPKPPPGWGPYTRSDDDVDRRVREAQAYMDEVLRKAGEAAERWAEDRRRRAEAGRRRRSRIQAHLIATWTTESSWQRSRRGNYWRMYKDLGITIFRFDVGWKVCVGSRFGRVVHRDFASAVREAVDRVEPELAPSSAS